MKIKRKPRPIGNKFKNVCNGRSKIVLNLELHKGKDIIPTKEYFKEFGATTACTLRLTKPCKASTRVVIADSWFGSVQSVEQLYNEHGLYAIMLVKTAHKNFPKLLLHGKELSRGEWTTVKANIKDVGMMAVLFQDIKEKQFIASCSTSLPGNPENPSIMEMFPDR